MSNNNNGNSETFFNSQNTVEISNSKNESSEHDDKFSRQMREIMLNLHTLVVDMYTTIIIAGLTGSLDNVIRPSLMARLYIFKKCEDRVLRSSEQRDILSPPVRKQMLGISQASYNRFTARFMSAIFWRFYPYNIRRAALTQESNEIMAGSGIAVKGSGYAHLQEYIRAIDGKIVTIQKASIRGCCIWDTLISNIIYEPR
ncbi:hypothetical protein PHYBLDRAFT_152277 [Phycomyces blakesleeanus NRRL 1555(-)]|uniref:Uncharacterized protein n=1 Tax=Phycomyces blakesleeanus (strain ATCC 8743b / DSM 1359 / FGSC 10004 / NBRC 33097 / NRRL 1555) TaxID=763407 RepID=A0A167JUH4_PHYB8|nr:hypothetical protein PHYBLDRAFT_152277 [Phycomyces blakesleeanus NRRL 1555(-)]OAD66729.1 hypothetical protein PHYBLDRAFT_152277 [Phycomyces blakesleeanus NRRL 1555(-)]|eukprot:XP_018284769.1 hypothetical protein PHYBLDRAFT_152277 [Phycomyces blakesleeanus NRRL 1555(-)]